MSKKPSKPDERLIATSKAPGFPRGESECGGIVRCGECTRCDNDGTNSGDRVRGVLGVIKDR